MQQPMAPWLGALIKRGQRSASQDHLNGSVTDSDPLPLFHFPRRSDRRSVN